MNDAIFDQMDFGPLKEFLDEDDITDVSYSNGGQIWLKTLSKGIYQVERPEINNEFMEKLAFQCSNVMGVTFNMAHPFLDAESAELRMNFVHDSIATNGIACVIRKTPAKIRLNREKLLNEQYVTASLHDFLVQCVKGRANIIVAGETGSGKTELVKYLASKTTENEKIITIEDTLELHLDKIFPHRDIVAMKTNNIASYSDVLVTCMRQNPIWILLSEVRSGEAVMAVRNSISSGHHILSTIHADKASSIPMRMYSLLESSQDINQFLASIHRYVQLGIYVKGYYSARLQRFQREIMEVCEFYVDEDNNAKSNIIYKKDLNGHATLRNPTKNLINYLSIGNVFLPDDVFGLGDQEEKEEDLNETAPVNETNATPVVPVSQPTASDSASVTPEVTQTVENSVQPVSVEPQSVETPVQTINVEQPVVKAPVVEPVIPQSSIMAEQVNNVQPNLNNIPSNDVTTTGNQGGSGNPFGGFGSLF